MKRIFVSFHHKRNQNHADKIRSIVKKLGYYDISVNEGTKIENEDHKTGEEIRREIRDKFLKNVDVTIVIAGAESKNRKHIDWEIRSTIFKFNKGRNGGIVVIKIVKDNCTMEEYLPERLKNSKENNVDFPILKYRDVILNNSILKSAIEKAKNDVHKNKDKWDINTKMRRKNSESHFICEEVDY